MKYIKQLAIILGAAFLGEALYALLPLPIPASIYGLLILALSLIHIWRSFHGNIGKIYVKK